MQVHHHRRTFRIIAPERRFNLTNIRRGCRLQAKTLCDRLEIRTTEEGQTIIQPMRAELVEFHSEAAIIQHHDEQFDLLPLDRIQFLNVHHDGAVAVQHNNLPVASRALQRPWP